MPDNEKKDTYDDEINLLDLLVVILKRKWMIIGITFSFALITAVISLIMTPIYKAETKILPPQASSSSISSQVLSKLGAASSLLGSTLGISSTNDQYIGMLASRTMYDYIIDRFGLEEQYKTEYIEDARAIIEDSVEINSGDDEIISVSVTDKDPERAADIANAFIEKLKEMTKTFAVTEASKRRLFFEEELKKTKEDLLKSEEVMQVYQEKTGAVSVDQQAKAIIESIADLTAQIAAKEVEIKVMKTYAEPKNPDLQKLEEELKGMKQELQKLEAKGSETADPILPTSEIPEIGIEYARKLRDLKYQETLFELMASQYEIARIDEARDATIIQVLDKAEPPEKRVKPKRTFMVVLATVSGFIIAVIVVFFMEFMENISKDERNKGVIELIKKYSSVK
jgi:tyrosine-protein kinase Etk/Wzc